MWCWPGDEAQRSNDILTWTFPPGMLDFDLSSDDDDKGDFEDDMEGIISSPIYKYEAVP
jgi:hypothetical protein